MLACIYVNRPKVTFTQRVLNCSIIPRRPLDRR